MSCQNCPGAPIEYDNATGSSYCTICGAVLEENAITSEIAFVESAEGASRMVGQFISAERSGLRNMSMRNRRFGSGQSREETIANAKRKFQEVATALRGLNEYHIERAVQCYKMALMQNFTQGRKQSHVIAACLYTVCRQEKTMHLLIDFCDILHTNVFVLGNTFMKLIRLLKISVPLIDPSLYLSRFAAELEFGDQTAQVTNDALRLVQRMKRDWIHYGRRPSGICGACLLIAARMHGFKRTQSEVTRVVKIGDRTLRKRLDEFAETDSATLTVNQFRSTDLSSESFPPSFKKSIRKFNFKSAAEPEPEEEEPQLKKRKIKESDSEQQETADEEGNEKEIEKEISQVMQSQDFQSQLKTFSTEIWLTQSQVNEDVAEWNDLNDQELESFILTTEETELKQEIWEEANADWIQRQQLKEEIEQQKQQQQPQDKTAEPKKRKPVQRKIRAKTPLEAAKEVFETRVAPKISKKINYEKLENIFGNDSILSKLG